MNLMDAISAAGKWVAELPGEDGERIMIEADVVKALYAYWKETLELPSVEVLKQPPAQQRVITTVHRDQAMLMICSFILSCKQQTGLLCASEDTLSLVRQTLRAYGDSDRLAYTLDRIANHGNKTKLFLLSPNFHREALRGIKLSIAYCEGRLGGSTLSDPPLGTIYNALQWESGSLVAFPKYGS